MSEPSPEELKATLERFRAELEEQDLIHEGDKIGTDDYTLKYVRLRHDEEETGLRTLVDDSFALAGTT